jgi:hypothetical protein
VHCGSTAANKKKIVIKRKKNGQWRHQTCDLVWLKRGRTRRNVSVITSIGISNPGPHVCLRALTTELVKKKGKEWGEREWTAKRVERVKRSLRGEDESWAKSCGSNGGWQRKNFPLLSRRFNYPLSGTSQRP